MAVKRIPVVGDKVKVDGFQGTYIVTRAGLEDVDVYLDGTDLEMFRVPVSKLSFLHK